MITQDTIGTILAAARIEEVVGDFVSLKRRGVNYIGLCPFHNEKTPSFTVSPAKGIFKCFGCGKAGNSVNFLMEYEHFTYPEALKFLAKRYHIEVEEEQQTRFPVTEQTTGSNPVQTAKLLHDNMNDVTVQERCLRPYANGRQLARQARSSRFDPYRAHQF